MKSYLFAACVALATLPALNASADTVTFVGSGTGPGSVPVSASAKFSISGNTLTITLTNTSASNSGQDVPGSTLTGLFWNSVSNAALTPVSASVAPGSSIIQSNTCDLGVAACASLTASTTNVGGEFGYQAAALPGSADRGVASSGYLTTAKPGNIGNFNNGNAGTNLDGPASLDGINFGIVSSAAGFNPNGGLAAEPLIQNAVIFVLTGVAGLTTADISNVSFQYGTALTELNVPGHPGTSVPEPGSLALVAAGLAGVSTLRRRKA